MSHETAGINRCASAHPEAQIKRSAAGASLCMHPGDHNPKLHITAELYREQSCHHVIGGMKLTFEKSVGSSAHGFLHSFLFLSPCQRRVSQKEWAVSVRRVSITDRGLTDSTFRITCYVQPAPNLHVPAI
jgi:hypothetical protein